MEEIDLKELFVIFWNKKIQILLVIIVFIIIGTVYTIGFTTPKYSASTTLVLAMTGTQGGNENYITTTDVTLNAKLVPTYRELVRSKNVLREVISNLDMKDENEDVLRKNVTVTSVEDADVIKIEVTHENAVYAAKIANEIAKVFSEKINDIYNIDNVYIVDEAEVNDVPSNINHTRDIIIFAFIGFVIALAYIFILNMLDTTVKSAEEIEKLYGVPVLASIPLIDSFENEKGGKK